MDVVAGRETRFEQRQRATGVAEEDSVDFDGDVSRRGEHIDTCVRVTRMDDGLVVFFELGVDQVPLERDQPVGVRTLWWR